MATNRRCKICGMTGHDARNCPKKYANSPKDKIMWYRIAGLTDRQADDLTSAFARVKRKIAPNAEVAFVKGDKKSLPARILKAIGVGKDDE